MAQNRKLSSNLEDRRVRPRRFLYGEVPVSLVFTDDRQRISSRVFNVSPYGLGIICGSQLDEGTAVTLVTLKGEVSLEVAWCSPVGREFQCGLKLVGEVDLRSIFKASEGR